MGLKSNRGDKDIFLVEVIEIIITERSALVILLMTASEDCSYQFNKQKYDNLQNCNFF